MTNLGPLTTTYTPTGANCQSTYIGANNDNQWIQYGQPNTRQCVPSNFTAFEDYYYSPGICPSGYTYACEAGIGTSTTQATCCPVGYTCRVGVANRDTDPFACASTYTSNTYLTAEYFQMLSDSAGGSTNTSTTTSTFYLASDSGFYVEAYGPIVRRSAGDPEWSSTSGSGTGAGTATSSTGQGSSAGSAATAGEASSTATASAQPESGLSVGASAGIGVGVGLGCIIFIGCIAAAYIIGKKKRRSQQKPESPDIPLYRDGVPVEGQVAELNSGWKPWELQGNGYQAVEMDGRGHMVEMDGQGHRIEMDDTSPPAELQGQASSGHYGHERQ
ncbi:hypothetical protein VP1G_05158 [Cytospora mali]|uniref:Uncharacterized protein n=1 Tax=Cytospora mali TaxID=578113 RepID=A0A194V1R2_CYTMA|nr:hypothetical protein VP1G_05158 [Valsa mali var. pyri (nom. inval.)]